MHEIETQIQNFTIFILNQFPCHFSWRILSTSLLVRLLQNAYIYWTDELFPKIKCETIFKTDPRAGEPPSYPAYPPRGDVPFTSPIRGFNPAHHNPPINLLEVVPMTSHLAQPGPVLPDFSGHATIKVEQESFPLANGLGMGVIPPPVLQDVVTHSVGPPDIEDTPMQEVPAQVENQVHPCISELLSSPHMLPCKILIPCRNYCMRE